MIKCKSIIEDAITDDIIMVREKQWRKELPQAFVSFITNNNGGIPTEEIIIQDRWIIERFLCIVPNISENPNGMYDIDAVITKYDEYLVFDENSLGADLIPFAQLSKDSLLCLCYKTAQPSVVVWQYAGSESFRPNLCSCASSFTEFLNEY